MLLSMTGFGEAQCDTDGISYLLEIKTLNNRFLKTSIKLPDALSFAEPEVEKIVREELNRGSITFILHMRSFSDQGPFEVNQTVVQHYVKYLEPILSQFENQPVHIDLANMLQLPGACQIRAYSAEEHESMLNTIIGLTRKALNSLRKTREDEGKGILADLENNCHQIREHLQAMSGLTGKVIEQYRQRLEKRVNEMLANANIRLDEEVLAREVAIFAERCDINEEMSRLNSHLDQFVEVCRTGDQIGRRLDFITQEMLREANTIGAKANNAEISHHVVEIKVAIDRLKEQVQNVE